jgi:acyl carrier protein
MERHQSQTLELIRAAVARVKESDLSATQPDDALELDSIARIALIAELENEFSIEIDSDAVQPEVFETLASLTALVEAQKA